MGKENAWQRLDNNITAKHPEIWKIIKWMAVGMIANIPELGIHQLCLRGFRALGVENLGIFTFLRSVIAPVEGYPQATVVYAFMISTAVGYTIAFILNRKATFHADSNVALSTFLYILLVIFVIFTNGLFVGPGISNLVDRLSMSPTLSEVVSKVLCMLLPGLYSYPINRFVIHRKRKEPEEEGPVSADA